MRKFPLTIYALIVTILILTASEDLYYDSNFIFFFIIWFLAMPLTAINQICVVLGAENNLIFQWFPIFAFFFLDVLVLYLRSLYFKSAFKKFWSKL